MASKDMLLEISDVESIMVLSIVAMVYLHLLFLASLSEYWYFAIQLRTTYFYDFMLSNFNFWER